jgi:hypothetical protein
MSPRLLAALGAALFAVIALHLLPVLLFAAALAALLAAHLLPVLLIGTLGTIAFLLERIATTVMRTGWRHVPARKVRASW